MGKRVRSSQRLKLERGKSLLPAQTLVGISGKLSVRKLKPLRRSKSDKIREKTLEQDYFQKCSTLECRLQDHRHLVELMQQLVCCNGKDFCDSPLCQELNERHAASINLIKFLLEQVGTSLEVLPKQTQAMLCQLLDIDKRLKVKLQSGFWLTNEQLKASSAIQGTDTSSEGTEFYQIFVYGIKDGVPLVLMLKQDELGQTLWNMVRKKCPHKNSFSFILLHHGRKITEGKTLREQGLTSDCNIHANFSLGGGEAISVTDPFGDSCADSPSSASGAQGPFGTVENIQMIESYLTTDKLSKQRPANGTVISVKGLCSSTPQNHGDASTVSLRNHPPEDGAFLQLVDIRACPESSILTKHTISTILEVKLDEELFVRGRVEHLENELKSIKKDSEILPFKIIVDSDQHAAFRKDVKAQNSDLRRSSKPWPIECGIFPAEGPRQEPVFENDTLQSTPGTLFCPPDASPCMIKEYAVALKNSQTGDIFKGVSNEGAVIGSKVSRNIIVEKIESLMKGLSEIKPSTDKSISICKSAAEADELVEREKDFVAVMWLRSKTPRPAEDLKETEEISILYHIHVMKRSSDISFAEPEHTHAFVRVGSETKRMTDYTYLFNRMKSLVSRHILKKTSNAVDHEVKKASVYEDSDQSYQLFEKFGTETEKMEFKEIFADPKKTILTEHLKKYSASFLNSEGGHILFGIAEVQAKVGFAVGISLSEADRKELLHKSSKIICNFWPPVDSSQFSMRFNKVNYDLKKNVLQYSKIKDESSKINDESPKINDESSKINDESPKIKDESSKINDESPKIKDESSKINDESPKIKDESSKINDESPKIKDESSKINDESPKINDESEDFAAVCMENKTAQQFVKIVRSEIGQSALLRLSDKRFAILVEDSSKLDKNNLLKLKGKISQLKKAEIETVKFEEVEASLKDLYIVDLRLRKSPNRIHLTSPFLTFCLDHRGNFKKMEPDEIIERFAKRDYQCDLHKLFDVVNGFEKQKTSYVLICSPFSLPTQERNLYGLVFPEWALVLDFDQNPNQEGHLFNIFKPLHDRYHVKRNLFLKTLDQEGDPDPRDGVCWCAVRGYEEINKTLCTRYHASWMDTYRHKMIIIENLITVINPNQLVVVCLWDKDQKDMLPTLQYILQHIFSCGRPTKVAFVCSDLSTKCEVSSRLVEPLERAGFEVKRDNIFVALPHEMARYVGAELPLPSD